MRLTFSFSGDLCPSGPQFGSGWVQNRVRTQDCRDPRAIHLFFSFSFFPFILRGLSASLSPSSPVVCHPPRQLTCRLHGLLGAVCPAGSLSGWTSLLVPNLSAVPGSSRAPAPGASPGGSGGPPLPPFPGCPCWGACGLGLADHSGTPFPALESFGWRTGMGNQGSSLHRGEGESHSSGGKEVTPEKLQPLRKVLRRNLPPRVHRLEDVPGAVPTPGCHQGSAGGGPRLTCPRSSGCCSSPLTFFPSAMPLLITSA